MWCSDENSYRICVSRVAVCCSWVCCSVLHDLVIVFSVCDQALLRVVTHVGWLHHAHKCVVSYVNTLHRWGVADSYGTRGQFICVTWLVNICEVILLLWFIMHYELHGPTRLDSNGRAATRGFCTAVAVRHSKSGNPAGDLRFFVLLGVAQVT